MRKETYDFERFRNYFCARSRIVLLCFESIRIWQTWTIWQKRNIYGDVDQNVSNINSFTDFCWMLAAICIFMQRVMYLSSNWYAGDSNKYALQVYENFIHINFQTSLTIRKVKNTEYWNCRILHINFCYVVSRKYRKFKVQLSQFACTVQALQTVRTSRTE